MNIAGGFDSAQEEMLHEAGFEPCYIRDLNNGDTIAIDHRLNRDAPTEMVVEALWTSDGGPGNVLSHWVGVLTTGRKVHCTYGAAFPVWRVAQ
jgi:hypothetical protein